MAHALLHSKYNSSARTTSSRVQFGFPWPLVIAITTPTPFAACLTADTAARRPSSDEGVHVGFQVVWFVQVVHHHAVGLFEALGGGVGEEVEGAPPGLRCPGWKRATGSKGLSPDLPVSR